MTSESDPQEILRELHDGYTTLENAVEEAIQGLRLGRNPDDVAVELEQALEQMDEGEIHE